VNGARASCTRELGPYLPDDRAVVEGDVLFEGGLQVFNVLQTDFGMDCRAWTERNCGDLLRQGGPLTSLIYRAQTNEEQHNRHAGVQNQRRRHRWVAILLASLERA